MFWFLGPVRAQICPGPSVRLPRMRVDPPPRRSVSVWAKLFDISGTLTKTVGLPYRLHPPLRPICHDTSTTRAVKYAASPSIDE